MSPTSHPTASPSRSPTETPTVSPTLSPSSSPSSSPTESVCAYPYQVDPTIANFPGYLATHFLVAVNEDNVGSAKWVPENGFFFIHLVDYNDDGIIDEISFSGTLVNTGFGDIGNVNKTLEIEFKASKPVNFTQCGSLGGTGDLTCPKCELSVCNNDEFLDWTFYKKVEGKIYGEDISTLVSSRSGDDICNITSVGLPLIQLGQSGNVKNLKLGLSTWLNCEGDQAPGANFRHTSDINIDIRPCVTDSPSMAPTLSPTETPTLRPTSSPTQYEDIVGFDL